MLLTDRIRAARQRLRDGSLGNEASVSNGVVLPIIDALGWSAFDPQKVYPEYKVEGRRVDFALLTQRGPEVFIEVKQPGLAAHADRQLFEYAFHVGVPLAVLTDGATWHFYVPSLQGTYDERRVYLLDLLERDPEESAERFERYLARDAVESGEALERARTDYNRTRQRKGAAEAIPQAWANLVSEPRLADLLAAEVESTSGFQPEMADVTAFLGTLAPRSGTLPIPSPRPTSATTVVREPPKLIAPRREIPWSTGSWTGKGVTLPAGTELRGQHRGDPRSARVEKGRIMYAGRGYASPSAAGVAATGRSTNGWTFWEVRRPGDADWVVLSTLRD